MLGKEKSLDLFNLFADLPTKRQQLQALNLLVILLPDANRDTLKVSRFVYIKYPSELGAWVAQLAKRPTLAQVMISRFHS